MPFYPPYEADISTEEDVDRFVQFFTPSIHSAGAFCEYFPVIEILREAGLSLKESIKKGESVDNINDKAYEYAKKMKNFWLVDRPARLKKLPYKEYLQSNYWKEFRFNILESVGWKCQLCNSTKNLNVHHRTYERLGMEDPEDVTVLCRKCHAKHHNVMEVPPS